MAHFGFNDVTGCLSGSNARGTGIRFSQSPLRQCLLENGQSPLRRYLLENGQVYGQSFEVQACWRLLGVVWAIVNRGPSWPPLKCWCSTHPKCYGCVSHPLKMSTIVYALCGSMILPRTIPTSPQQALTSCPEKVMVLQFFRSEL